MRNTDDLVPPCRTIDLFCGCGGMSLGFQQAGFDLVGAYDNWRLAVDVYRANFAHPVECMDLSDVEVAAEKLARESPDMIIGGPPCQDFSIAGKRVESKQASLTVKYAQIVALVKPAIVVMENVYSIEKTRTLELTRDILRAAGYGITERIIDASRVGVPQMRKRFFLIGAQGSADGAFEALLDGGVEDRRMCVGEYFGPELDIEYYYAHPRSYKRRAIFSRDEPSATIRRVNRPMPPNYRGHPADKTRPSERIRPLTFLERSRIQTFPKDFQFLGSQSQREHLMANAVPVLLARYVGEKISAFIELSTAIQPRLPVPIKRPLCG